MRRFFLDPLPPTAPATLTLDDAESHHLRTVLRARVGELIGLLDGHGGRGEAELVDLGGRRGAATVRLRRVEHLALPSVRLVLYVAPPRNKLMDQVVKQATELGVAEIRPILTERAVAHPDRDALAGWQADAREACKQSGNPWLPLIAPPEKLAAVLAPGPCPGYIGRMDGGDPAPGTGSPAHDGRIALWIGPEGGFTDAEVEAIAAAGAAPLRLGPWILRVETAVVAGLAVLHRLAPPV